MHYSLILRPDGRKWNVDMEKRSTLDAILAIAKNQEGFPTDTSKYKFTVYPSGRVLNSSDTVPNETINFALKQ